MELVLLEEIVVKSGSVDILKSLSESFLISSAKLIRSAMSVFRTTKELSDARRSND